MELRSDPRQSVRGSTMFEEVKPLRRKSSAKPPAPAINHKKHSCTDVHCLLIFVAFIVAWCYIAHYAWTNGDLDKVLIPTDSKNRKCGVDSGVRNKKHLFFFDLDKCLDPLVPMNGCKTKQICVESCPQKTFVWGEHMMGTNLEELKKLLICDEDLDKTKLRNHNDVAVVISQGRCSGWYLQSSSIFNHCIPFAKVDFCNLMPDSLKSRKRRHLPPLLQSPDSLLQTSSLTINMDSITDSFIYFRNRTLSLCSESKNQATDLALKEKLKQPNTGFTKIIAALLFTFKIDGGSEKMAEDISEDLKSSWKVISLAFFIHLLVVLTFIALLRWVAKPLVWISIFGVIAGLTIILMHSVKQYYYWRDAPHAPQHNLNLAAQFQNFIQNYRFWHYLSIVTGAALAIILLILIVIRKRIAIAIAIVKEASKAITCIKSTIFFPIMPGILYIIATIVAAIVVLYLNSIGDYSFRVYKQLDSNAPKALEKCMCNGPAASYKLEGKCKPEIFESHCFIENTNNPCVETVCRFVEIEKTTKTQMFIYFSIFGYLWVTFFISAYGDMVLACTFSMWYWTFNKKNLTTTPLLKAIGITTLYHMGTIAFGSLVLAICRMIRYILEVIEKKAKLYNNTLTRAILCCMKCFFWILENFLRFLNRNAYITCAIHSTSFCDSSKKAFALIAQNILRMYAVDKVSDFLFFLSKLLLTGCTSFATYVFLIKYPNVIIVHYPLVPIVLVAILAYIMADVIFSTYSMAVDTLFFCFLEDSNENDGSPEKPFYMSKELNKVLAKKKTIQTGKQQMRINK